jgi:endonuclease/exonuclease/phosphatase family metal-dependent hydrolase
MLVKVLSLNLWQGGKLFPAIIDFLKTEKPDILLCQEVYNAPGARPENHRSVEVIQQHLAFPYYDFEPMFIDVEEDRVDCGLAVFSKYPVADRHITFFIGEYSERVESNAEAWATSPRMLQHVVLDTPGGQLNVFNMHGVWDLDGDNFSERRRKMRDTLLQAVKGKSNVILAGDSNAKPTNPAMQALEKPLQSVFGAELTSTFNMRRKDNPGYATAAVDLMYVSPSIRVLDKSCPDVDISDHLPITATLVIPEGD